MLAFKASSSWRSSARSRALIRAETTGPRMGVPFDFPRLLALVVDLDPALEVEGGSQVSSPSLPLGVDGGVGMDVGFEAADFRPFLAGIAKI